MPLTELDESALLDGDSAGRGTEAVLFYTPFCGTCKAAERMLDVAAAAGVPVKLYKMNVAFAPRLREAWRIASVPCLAVLRDGRPVRFEYAMRSVVHLYAVLKEAGTGPT